MGVDSLNAVPVIYNFDFSMSDGLDLNSRFIVSNPFIRLDIDFDVCLILGEPKESILCPCDPEYLSETPSNSVKCMQLV